MLIQWSQLLSSPSTDSSQPDSIDLNSYDNHQDNPSELRPSHLAISMRPFAKPRISLNSNLVHSNRNDQLVQDNPHPISYVKMEGDIDDDDINWERDFLGKPLNDHQREVVEAMVHSWRGYRKYAWGYDTLKPLSKSGSNWFGVGLTIIDSLDTLLVMGLHQEFKEALDWIEKDLNFHRNEDVNCFEMTIRVLGGLLSAYHLTRSYVILSKAVDVGDRLIHCFDSPLHLVPYSDVNLLTKTPKTPLWSPESSSSEVSTMQVEFRDLARITKQYAYETTTFRTSEHIHNLTRDDPLIPMYINPNTGLFTPSTITLGARADSYYEYLFKQYLQTSIPWLKQDFLQAMDAIRNRLTRQTQGPLKLSFIGEIVTRYPSRIHPKMDHLVCFLPGLLALSHLHLTKEDAYIDDYSTKSRIDQLMPMSLSLARTCYYMYNLTATGLSPEIAYFNEEGENELQIRPADTHNLLRPEYVESLFYLYHITGDEKYRKQGLEVS